MGRGRVGFQGVAFQPCAIGLGKRRALQHRAYLNISATFALNHSQPLSCRGGWAVQLRSVSTRRKSLGTSNSVSSRGPSFNSTTSEPQVEESVRLLPSGWVTSLVNVVVIF